MLILLYIHQLMEFQPLTLGIRYVLDHIAVLDDFDDTAYESLRTLGCVVDCDERVGSFGSWRGHPASFFLLPLVVLIDLVVTGDGCSVDFQTQRVEDPILMMWRMEDGWLYT
jgi:hypothetical protein